MLKKERPLPTAKVLFFFRVMMMKPRMNDDERQSSLLSLSWKKVHSVGVRPSVAVCERSSSHERELGWGRPKKERASVPPTNSHQIETDREQKRIFFLRFSRCKLCVGDRVQYKWDLMDLRPISTKKIFVFNKQGGRRERERKAFSECKRKEAFSNAFPSRAENKKKGQRLCKCVSE